MNNQLTQQQINQAAWAACDTFRGPVDPAAYKDYILVTLFLKYISDLWNDHVETYREQFGGDEARIRRRLERERFVLPEGSSFYDLYDQRNEANIGELINMAFEKIEDANRGKLEGVFRNIDFNSDSNLGRVKDRNRRLKNLLEDFAKPALDLRPSRVTEDIIGECYIYLISRFASDAGKKAGEFYTPSAVSGLLAKLAAPKPGNTICDPACGSGSLLIQASQEVGSDNFALFGQEVNGATWALARMNMFLHAKDAARIEWCDTLNSPALVEGDQLMKFDIVVANPPFSLDKWGAEDAGSDQFKRFWRGIPPKSKADFGFITHMIEIAKRQSGRVAVIVPHGVLFRGGAEGKIRQALIEENLLDAVVGLPANLFTTTGIPVAILIFDRSREQGGANEARKDVLFIDASKEFTLGKTQNVMDEAHIAKVLATAQDRTEIAKYSYLASPEEIAENEFNLNIPRYVDTSKAEAEIDVETLQKDIKKIEAELARIRGEMAAHLQALIYTDEALAPVQTDEWREVALSEVLTEHGLKSTGSEEVFSVSVHKGLVNQIEHLGRSFAAAETSHYNRVLPGDIVYTKSPTGDFPLGIIKQSKISQEVIVSPLYGVFTPATQALGVILDALFESPVAVHNYLNPLVQKGAKNTIAITNRRFLEGKLRLPMNPSEQEAIARIITASRAELNCLHAEVEARTRQKSGLLQKLLTGEWRVNLEGAA